MHVARHEPFRKEDPVKQLVHVVSLQTEQLTCRQAMQIFDGFIYVPSGQV